MKLFIDANVLVAVLLKEYGHYTSAARVLSLSKTKYSFATTSVCLAIAFYFAEKKFGSNEAKRRIGILADYIRIIACGQVEASTALADQRVHDFEDGLEYYAALHAGCKCIITNDLDDYYYSDLEVLSPQQFLEKYLL